MTIEPRSFSATVYGTRDTTVVPAPAGATTGDVIIAIVAVGGPAASTVVAPPGWTLVKDAVYANSDPWSVDLAVYVKPYDGAASWSWTHESNDSQAFATAWTGVDTATPIDVAASSAVWEAISTNATAPSITTVTDGCRLVVARGSWDGNPITPPTGWTERHDQPVIWVGDQAQATAGATGSVVVPAGNGGGTGRWGIILLALRPGDTSPSSGSVTAATTGLTARAIPPVAAGRTDVHGGSVLALVFTAHAPAVSSGRTVNVPVNTKTVVVSPLAPMVNATSIGAVVAPHVSTLLHVNPPSFGATRLGGVNAPRVSISGHAQSPAMAATRSVMVGAPRTSVYSSLPLPMVVATRVESAAVRALPAMGVVGVLPPRAIGKPPSRDIDYVILVGPKGHPFRTSRPDGHPFSTLGPRRS